MKTFSFALLLFCSTQLLIAQNDSYAYVATKGIANPANPFDRVGAMHNTAVVATGNAVKWNPKSTAEQVETEMTAFLKDNQNIDATPIFERRAELDEFANSDNPAEMLRTKGFSKAAILYYQRIENASGDNILAITNNIKTVESEIMANRDLTQTEKDALLSTASVTRYSRDLWSKMLRETNSPLYRSTNTAANNSSKAKEVGLADLRGAVTGAIIGGLIFGQALPGAVAGAARASVFAAFTVTAS